MGKTQVLGIAFIFLFALNLQMTSGSIFTLNNIFPFKWTQRLGSSMGNLFQWYSTIQTSEIRQISGFESNFINQIMVVTQDGPDSDMSPQYGVSSGNPYSWTVPEGEHITKIIYAENGNLISMVFVTDRGTMSPKFGGEGGVEKIFYIQNGYQLVGIFGSSSSYITSIGFALGRIPPKMKTPRFGSPKSPNFQWMSMYKYGQILQISGEQSTAINQISFVAKEGANSENSPVFGTSGGTAFSWAVPSGEHIKQIHYRINNNMLISLQFTTDKGSQSPEFGGNVGSQSTYVIPDGYMLVGVYGCNEGSITSLGFYIGRMQTVYSEMFGQIKGSVAEWQPVQTPTDLARLTGKSSNNINQLKFTLRNGESSPALGGTGGTDLDFMIPADESVRKITLKRKTHVKSATFITNKGSEYKFGGNAGHTTLDIYVPFGFNLVGLKVASNNSRIFSIAFIFK